MISLPIAAALAVAVPATAFISGIFGMAGGMILMGILLALLPLAPAMVLHGVTQTASNFWRAWLWRQHINWKVVGGYAGGAAFAALIFAAVWLIPSKPVSLIILGMTPFAGLALPSRLAPDVLRRGHSFACGAVCTGLQLLAGVCGPILDVFFVRSALDRKQIIATKAAAQVIGHSLKVAYFGQLLLTVESEVSPALLVLAVTLALIGTQLSRRALDAINDSQFRVWSRRLIAAIATVYLVQGVYLLVSETRAAAAAAQAIT